MMLQESCAADTNYVQPTEQPKSRALENSSVGRRSAETSMGSF